MRKPDSLLLLGAIVGLSVIATTLAQADTLDLGQGRVEGVEAPLSPCSAWSPYVRPCAYAAAYQTLSYRAHLGDAAAEWYLDSDAPQLLMSFKIGHSAQVEQRLFKAQRSMELNFGVDAYGPIMNLELGRLDLNMTLEDGDDAWMEPLFFIGIDDRW